jgi:ATPase
MAKKKDDGAVLDKIVPDTSVIIEGILSDRIENGSMKPKQILIHEAVLAELEHQANENKTTGILGLDELKNLKKISVEKEFEIIFSGKRPSASEIRYAKLGEIDSLIRELAFEEGAVLVTADRVQSRIADAKGISCIFVEFEKKPVKIKLETFFDNTTMSVHLRDNVEPIAKKGIPGNWKFEIIRKSKMTAEEIKAIEREIVEEAGMRKDSFVEIERPGSTIVQFGVYRTVITRPPFSDGWEITSVKPVKRLALKDYDMSEKLLARITEQAEGILIAGSPGMGKSTFAQALAEFYAAKGRIVKTIEAPRDLILNDNVTQYAISHGSSQEIHDVLLLSRPDNTLFDEMRNTSDFNLFADLRLAGIGLAGVVHATNPIDAIQRFVGRIELGVIPQVIDTVIFIKNGQIAKVLSLQMVVKVPSGMMEADLARPVVVVNDFDTKKLEYELYSYGEETVVIPVMGEQKSPVKQMAAKAIEQEFKRYAEDVKVEVKSDNSCVVYVPEHTMARIIGRGGSNIESIEKNLGIHIDLQELQKSKSEDSQKKEVQYNTKITKKGVNFFVDRDLANKSVDIYIGKDFVATTIVSKKGVVKIHTNNKMAKVIIDAINTGEKLRILSS